MSARILSPLRNFDMGRTVGGSLFARFKFTCACRCGCKEHRYGDVLPAGWECDDLCSQCRWHKYADAKSLLRS